MAGLTPLPHTNYYTFDTYNSLCDKFDPKKEVFQRKALLEAQSQSNPSATERELNEKSKAIAKQFFSGFKEEVERLIDPMKEGQSSVLYFAAVETEFIFRSKFRASIIKVLSGAETIEVSRPPSPLDSLASSSEDLSD